MSQREYQQMIDALEKQRQEVTSSKKAAKKLLTDFGVLHLLVPKVAK